MKLTMQPLYAARSSALVVSNAHYRVALTAWHG